jgi:hypothetical protein
VIPLKTCSVTKITTPSHISCPIAQTSRFSLYEAISSSQNVKVTKNKKKFREKEIVDNSVGLAQVLARLLKTKNHLQNTRDMGHRSQQRQIKGVLNKKCKKESTRKNKKRERWKRKTKGGSSNSVLTSTWMEAERVSYGPTLRCKVFAARAGDGEIRNVAR